MSAVSIRHSESRDVEQIRQMFVEPSNYASTLQLPYPSVELWDKYFSNRTEGHFSLVACQADTILGQLGLDVSQRPRRRHVATLGMAVKTAARRQGVGSALLNAGIELAERWCAVRRIEIQVYVDNEPAIALYRKFNFGIEGTYKQYAFRDGAFVDAYGMARLAI
jgi:L-phenylalanine/L-methionine N-acetyltransferase